MDGNNNPMPIRGILLPQGVGVDPQEIILTGDMQGVAGALGAVFSQRFGIAVENPNGNACAVFAWGVGSADMPNPFGKYEPNYLATAFCNAEVYGPVVITGASDPSDQSSWDVDRDLSGFAFYDVTEDTLAWVMGEFYEMVIAMFAESAITVMAMEAAIESGDLAVEDADALRDAITELLDAERDGRDTTGYAEEAKRRLNDIRESLQATAEREVGRAGATMVADIEAFLREQA